jgi:hypothetical protein
MTDLAKPNQAATSPTIVSGKPNFFDILFLIFLACMLGVVAWVGMLSYAEGVKNKSSVQNGEAWVTWLKNNSEARMKEDFPIESCAFNAEERRRWGDCMAEILENVTELRELKNPVNHQPVAFVAKCVPKDPSTFGAIFLEKNVPTAPGSAIPAVASQLTDMDPIDTKMALKLTVCDKGGYPIKVDEFEF